MSLTTRDRRLFRILTTQLRVASSEQLARATESRSSLRRRLHELAQRGLLGRASLVVARPPLDGLLVGVAWGEPAPDFGAVAWRLRQRWRAAAAERLTIHWATAAAARMFGGVGGRLRQPFQVAHDLLVADVFLLRCALDEATRSQWLGEDAYRREFGGPGEKVPDAVLLDERGEVERAIEVGGEYAARRLAVLHRHCRRRGWSYEIW